MYFVTLAKKNAKIFWCIFILIVSQNFIYFCQKTVFNAYSNFVSVSEYFKTALNPNCKEYSFEYLIATHYTEYLSVISETSPRKILESLPFVKTSNFLLKSEKKKYIYIYIHAKIAFCLMCVACKNQCEKLFKKSKWIQYAATSSLYKKFIFQCKNGKNKDKLF